MLRLTLHIAFDVGIAGAGLFVFSYKIFPLLLGAPAPVAPMIGMATGLALVAIAGLAGLGFGLIGDLLRREFTPAQIPRTRLFDLLAGTQYLTAALVLVLAHYQFAA